MTKGRRLVAMRCVDCEPHVYSVVDQCSRCGHAVWRALTSPEADEVYCVDCFAVLYHPDQDEIEVGEQQICEVYDYFGVRLHPKKGRTSS